MSQIGTAHLIIWALSTISLEKFYIEMLRIIAQTNTAKEVLFRFNVKNIKVIQPVRLLV